MVETLTNCYRLQDNGIFRADCQECKRQNTPMDTDTEMKMYFVAPPEQIAQPLGGTVCAGYKVKE